MNRLLPDDKPCNESLLAIVATFFDKTFVEGIETVVSGNDIVESIGAEFVDVRPGKAVKTTVGAA